MTDAEILFERRGSIGLVTLNRPKALNALTLGMIHRFDPQLRAWAEDPAVKAVVVQGAGDRAYCAGGDVMELYNAGKALKESGGQGGYVRDFFLGEYSLNRLIKRFPKPYVALMDGITMGGGVGVSVHGSHRVATERTLFAMPETGIGIFPDVGGSYFLPRCPGRLGAFLGLTGERLKAADCLYAGLVDSYVPSDRLESLIADIAESDGSGAAIDSAIARHAGDAGEAPLAAHRDSIDRCFGPDALEAIQVALDAEGTDWAKGARATLARMSPVSLKVTLEAIRRGAALDFEDCMVMEFRLSQALLADDNFYEGIRALLVDKDKNPRWTPGSAEEVSDAEVLRHFEAPAAGDLRFDR